MKWHAAHDLPDWSEPEGREAIELASCPNSVVEVAFLDEAGHDRQWKGTTSPPCVNAYFRTRSRNAYVGIYITKIKIKTKRPYVRIKCLFIS